MISDMAFLMILLVLAIVAVVATVRSALHDGPTRPPRSHDVDPDFVAPGARASY